MVAPNPHRPVDGEPSQPRWPVVFIEPDPHAAAAPPKRRGRWFVLAIFVGIALPVTSWFAGRSSSRPSVELVPVPLPAEAASAAAPPVAPPHTSTPTAAPAETLTPPTRKRPKPIPRPARPSAASTAPAHLYINSVPWGLVSIDDNPIGNTPLVGLPLSPGVHRIRVEHAGYVAYEGEVDFTPGETLRLTDIVLQESAQ